MYLKQMFAVYEAVPSIKQSLESQQDEFACTAIGAQLRRMIAKQLVQVEVQLLSKVENLVCKAENVGRQNPIAVWVLLWILIFSYRDHMIYIAALWNGPSRGMKIEGPSREPFKLIRVKLTPTDSFLLVTSIRL